MPCSNCKKEGHNKRSCKSENITIKADIPKLKKSSSTRTKENTGVNERNDIKFIINAIHTRSPVGIMLINAFYEKFGDILIDARDHNGSNRRTHSDFEIMVHFADGTESWKRVEHKGSKSGVIRDSDKPWLAGVQFYNGGCGKYTIAKDYAQIHYDKYIASGDLTRVWNLNSAIPSFSDWWKDDCRSQANPKTPFGIELKAAVRKIRGADSSLRLERKPVIEALTFGPDAQAQLIKEVLPIANSVLEEKDYWLSIRGSLEENDFNLAWYPKSTIGAINSVDIIKKDDVWFEFNCTDDFKFKGILRWGKGAGFSCLRIDLR